MVDILNPRTTVVSTRNHKQGFFSSVQMLALRHKIMFAFSEKLLESTVNAAEARAHQYIILTFFNCAAMG